jgi:hypothetical protein
MRTSKKASINNGVRVLTALLLLVAFFAVPSYSGLSESPIKIQTVDLPGLTGAANNVIHVNDRYVLAAPFAPKPIEGDEEEAEDLDVEKLDNHFLYIIDTKKPSGKITPVDLKGCYFPSRMMFDAQSRTVFIRGTEFYKNGKGEDAQREVIVHLHLNLDEDGKPFFDPDPPVTIPIQGHDSEFSEDAPSQFVLGRKGKILVYTNGKSIFTYNVITGDHYAVHFAEDVAYLDIDEETDTLFISLNRDQDQGEGGIGYTSEIMFYRLRDDGRVDLIKRVKEGIYGSPISLIPGSNAAIISSLASETGEYRPDLAFFIDSKGALCQVELRSAGTDALAEEVEYYPDLAQSDSLTPSPRLITYNRARRALIIIKRGFVWDIRRPTFNRPGHIRRPTFARGNEPASLVLVQLNKKNRVVKGRVFSDEFAESGGLSNHLFNEDKIIVAGFDGNLYSVEFTDDLGDMKPVSIGELGTRVEFISNSGTSTVYVAINSFESDEEGCRIVNPGSLVIGKLVAGASQ